LRSLFYLCEYGRQTGRGVAAEDSDKLLPDERGRLTSAEK